jgi:proteasome accessory factor C
VAESSPDRLARLLTLVPWLTAHSGVSKAAAAEHFGLTVAQLEADLQLISFTGPGLYGGELVDIYFDDETITVFDSQGLDRPLQLTSDEVSTLLIGLRALQQLPDADVESIASALSKLTAASDTAVDVAFDVVTPNAVAVIADAIAARRDVDIDYVHPLRDDTTSRRITPLRLFSADGADYVEAWCHVAEANRTFRLDRVLRCTATGASVVVHDIAPTSTSLHKHARVRVALASRHVLESTSARITAEHDVVEAEIDYADDRWLTQWAIAAGGGVEIVEPAGAQQAARERAAGALLAYGGIATVR